MSISVEFRLHPNYGACIGGVDPREPLGGDRVAELRKLLDEHHLLLIRSGRVLEPAEQLRFVASFGEAEALPASSQPGRGQAIAPGFPQVFRTTNSAGAGGALNAGTEGWHNDGLYREVPTDVIGYHLVLVPEVGGDTLFANGHLGYETLPDSIKEKLENAKAVHGRGWQGNTVHTLVRTHPRTGKKALYVSLGLADTTKEDSTPGTLIVVGWTHEEMCETFERIDAHLRTPEIMYRHKWQQGDLILSDNAAMLHRGEITDPKYPRILHRVSTMGKKDLQVQHAFKPMTAQR